MATDDHSARNRAFCRWYAVLGDPREAALRAGFPEASAAEEALRLLQTRPARAYLEKLLSQPPLPERALVLAGLSRLAFGRANDAARLIFGEAPDAQALQSLDLFQVSERKRDKAGGVEIKLFDRQKALERLLECAAQSDQGAQARALLEALGGDA